MTEENFDKYPLNELKSGEEGEIGEIYGGGGFTQKLSVRGIRVGKKIKKISGYPLRGPVVIDVEGSGICTMGYGMAKRIMVYVYETDEKP